MKTSNEVVIVMSDEDLVARLASLCLDDARVKSEIVTYLIEVEERRIHLRMACSSMMDFCTRRLKMSPNVAFLRIASARLARRHPCVLPAIARGELHLSTPVLLKHHLTASNAEGLLVEVRGKSVREVEELLAARAPKPDIASTIAPLVEQTVLPSGSRPSPKGPGKPVARIAPLSPARFALQMTVSQEVRDKLERAKDLMRHRNPDGDLAVILDRALDTLLAKLEKECRGKADRPRGARGGRRGSISRAATREVFERDGEQCTFVGTNGDRCPARGFLERDHIASRALGGNGDVANIRVLCKSHNRLHAEDVFGRKHVERAIDLGRRPASSSADARVSEAAPVGATATEGRADDTIDFGRPMSPDQRTRDDDHTRALSGLMHLGFKRGEATRALDRVLECRAQAGWELPDVLREAIGLLT